MNLISEGSSSEGGFALAVCSGQGNTVTGIPTHHAVCLIFLWKTTQLLVSCMSITIAVRGLARIKDFTGACGRGRFWRHLRPWVKSSCVDGRYNHFKEEMVEEVEAGTMAVATVEAPIVRYRIYRTKLVGLGGCVSGASGVIYCVSTGMFVNIGRKQRPPPSLPYNARKCPCILFKLARRVRTARRSGRHMGWAPEPGEGDDIAKGSLERDLWPFP